MVREENRQMSQESPHDIIIRVDAIDQLFIAPEIDPLSDKPAVVLGEAALSYTVRQALSRGARRWNSRRLIIQLPPDQITPETKSRAVAAVRRYAAVKEEDNNARVRIARQRGWVALGLAIAIAAVALIALVIVVSTVLASASDAVKGLLAGIATIFIWATVWNPVDRLVFEWVGPSLENRILRTLASAEIVIEPEAT
jgi:hypothetical protein